MRSVGVALAGALLSLAACGTADKEDGGAPISSPSAPVASSLPRVAFVTGNARSTSGGLAGLYYKGYDRAVKRYGLRRSVVVVPLRENRVHGLMEVARQGYDALIVAACCNGPDEIATVARRFPGVRFLVQDPPFGLPPDLPNVEAVVFHVEEAAYLAGYLAVLMEKRRDPGRPTIGSVGGEPTPPVAAFIAGYQAGARAADPSVRIANQYTNDFENPRLCASATRRQLRRGAGVVFNVAGDCGLATVRAAGQRGSWAIGVDVDQSALAPRVLTSVEKRVDVGVVRAVRDLARGRFRPGALRLGLAERAVGLGKVHAGVPEDVRRRLARIEADIVAGRIAVPSTLN